MPIVSSAYTLSAQQADGGKWVREAHTAGTGQVVYVDYSAPDGTDYQAVMTARVAQINEQLSAAELRAQLAGDVAFAPAENTLAQLAARFWAWYDNHARDADKTLLHRLLWWIYQQIQAGFFTSDQVRQSYNAYFGTGYTLAQWNTYVTNNILPVVNRYSAWIAQQEV